MTAKLRYSAPRPPWKIRRNVLRAAALVALLGMAMPPLTRADDDDDAKPAKPARPAVVQDPNIVTLAPAAITRYGVEIGAARKQKLISHLVVPARVSFNTLAMAVVGCPVQGRVAQLGPIVGDVVKRGDALLAVESPELGEAQSDYRLKSAAVAAAEIVIDPAKSAYERAKALYDSSKGITLTELQKRELDFRTAENALLVARASLQAADSKLHLMGMNPAAIAQLLQSGQIDPRYIVRAPLDGTLTERTVTLGELVKPDREKLVVLADMSTLWVLADVPEARLREVSIGGKASVSVPALGDTPIEGKVARVGVTVDPASRTVRVQIDVKGQPALKPGMFGEADLLCTLAGDDGQQAVLAVPSSAVFVVDGSTAVFVPVKDKPNTYERRLVSVGNAAGGMTAIISGLAEGEKIVIGGGSILKAEAGKNSLKDEDD